MSVRKVICTCGKRMRRAHSFRRRYWSPELYALKMVYRCECGETKAIVLFDETDLCGFIERLEAERAAIFEELHAEKRKQGVGAARRRKYDLMLLIKNAKEQLMRLEDIKNLS